jgi:hypothetical protein
MTRTVVNVFGLPPRPAVDRPETFGDYVMNDVVADFTGAFPDQVEARGGEVQVAQQVYYFGPSVLRSSVINGLENAGRESIEDVTGVLSELAGGDDHAKALAEKVKKGLKPWTTHLPDGAEATPSNPDAAAFSLIGLAQSAVQHSIEDAADGEAA